MTRDGRRTDGVLIPVSPGELIDKLTILEIKRARITDATALAHVAHEHALLTRALGSLAPLPPAVAALKDCLRAVNGRLWDIEDAVRAHEARQDFGDTFIDLARSVYQTNDERCAVKHEINRVMGSTIVEVKSYGVPEAPR